MDTGTHVVMGVGIAGLAFMDPAVAADPTLATAVFVGAVLGGQAPDFDGLLRLKNNTIYIRNHRGLSHSPFFLLLWTLLITTVLSLIWHFPWGGASFLHLGMWVLISAVYHVFSDLFNTYGTQGARPFTKQWISWNIIHIFDPTIFTAHVIAILLWAGKVFAPQHIFPTLYLLIAVYYIWRTIVHYRLEAKLPAVDATYREGESYIAIPTVSLTHWHVVKTRVDGAYVVGHYDRTGLTWFETAKYIDHPAIESSKQDPTVQALLQLSSYTCAEVRKIHAGYIVRWSDVRYRHRKQYPFVAIVLMDHELNTLDSYIGWISDDQIEKKWSLLS